MLVILFANNNIIQNVGYIEILVQFSIVTDTFYIKLRFLIIIIVVSSILIFYYSSQLFCS